MKFSVIFSKSLPWLLKKAKNFLLKSSVQHWEAASVASLVNTAQALFLISLGEKCLVVSIHRLSRAISARTGDYVPLVLMVSFSLEPLSNLPNNLLPKQKGRVGLMALFPSMLSVLASPWHLLALEVHPEVEGAVPSSIVRNFSSSAEVCCSACRTLHALPQMQLMGMRGCLQSGKSHLSGVASQAWQYQLQAWQCLNTTSIWHPQSSPSWNWVRQDTLLMYYDIIFGRLTTIDQEITASCIALLNWTDPNMFQFMQYNINQCDASKGEAYRLVK